MERKTKFLIFTGMLSVTILAGCLENDETQTENSSSEITVAEAQKSFESSAKTFHLSPSEVTRKADEELLSIPLWAKASVLDFEKRKIVEVPIEGPSEFMHMKQNPNDSISQKRHWCNTAIRLIAEKSTNGDIFFTIARITVGGDYLKRHKKRPLSVSFSTIKDFSGIVRYYSLDGELISGRKYDKGKVIGTISPCDSTRTIAQTRSQEYVCEMVEVEHYKYYCTDTYLGGELIQTTCEEVDSWTEWEEQCEWVDVPDVVCPNCGENPCICGQGGGTTDPENPVETVYTAELKRDKKSINLLDNYGFSVSIKPTQPANTKIEFRIGWKDQSDTKYWILQTGTILRCDLLALKPGKWDIYACITIGNSEIKTQTQSIEVQFPNVISIEKATQSHMDAIWQDTKNAASSAGRREKGFWIYINTTTRQYEYGATITGELVQGSIGTHGSVPLYESTYKVDEAPDSPLLGGKYYIAFFHAHTPLTYCTDDGSRQTGPSITDSNWAYNDGKIPALVYDYIGMKDGENSIVNAGHKIDLPAKVYRVGPTKRSTPTN